MVPLSFADTQLMLTEGRALYWPAHRALLVADLHLEQASFFAQHGSLLPPYDSRETLERVAIEIERTGARRVITLGDNFHDAGGGARLEEGACAMLEKLTGRVEWTWITGNHDVGKDGRVAEADCGGSLVEEMELGGVILRHRAKPGETHSEISGHFHPRMQLSILRRRIRRPCAVLSHTGNGANRLIAPAFGALTAGMPAGDPAILKALQPARSVEAVLPIKGRLVRFPLWKARQRDAA